MLRPRRETARCEPRDDRPRAPGIGCRNYRGPEGLRHVERFSRTGAALRRCDCEFRRRGAPRFRGVREARPHLRPDLYGPQYRRDTALQRPYHLQLRLSVRTFRAAGPLSAAFRAACGSIRSIRPSKRTFTTPAFPARGWALRPNSWRRTADFRRASRGCISTSSANRARNTCGKRWKPSRRISGRTSIG